MVLLILYWGKCTNKNSIFKFHYSSINMEFETPPLFLDEPLNSTMVLLI